MSLDTVRVATEALTPLSGTAMLDVDDWLIRTQRQRDRADPDRVQEVETGFVVTDGGVRVEWRSPSRIAAEVSLPKAMCGDNAILLTWQECERGIEALADAALAALPKGIETPPLPYWRVQRADVVGAWPLDPPKYIAAARQVQLPRLDSRCFPTSIAWCRPGGDPVMRLYDKRVEAERDVENPLRLEVQVRRPSYWTYRGSSGRRVGHLVRNWNREVALDVLQGAVEALGFDREGCDPWATRDRLISYWEGKDRRRGRSHGLACWSFLRDVQECGSAVTAEPDPQRRRRLIRDCREAGVVAVGDGVLPPLGVSALLAGADTFIE